MTERWAPPLLDDGAWYHGSPERIEVLLTGSTITRSRAVAEAFSHRPTLVSLGEGGEGLEVTHNGTRHGYLYVIDELVTAADVHPHPNSSYPGGGMEWLTDRPLRLRLIAELPICACARAAPRRL